MANVIYIDQYKNQKLSRRCFNSWKVRFRETYTNSTQLAEISDKTLLYLATPGEKSTSTFYELIQNINDLTPQQPNPTTDSATEVEKMDIHFYLADKVRFEMMVRLGWLESYPQQQLPIIELVRQFKENHLDLFNNPPQLSTNHPGYEEFRKLIIREQELFIRKLFVSALSAFKAIVRS